MGMETAGVTLDTIGGGVAGELFAQALALIAKDYLDPNKAVATREINLKFVFMPSEDYSKVKIFIKSKLAPRKPITTICVFGRGPTGCVEVAEMRPVQQLTIDDAVQDDASSDAEETENLILMRKRERE